MTRPLPRFPTGFLLGAATAAHQIEGNNLNADLWDAEWTRHSIFAEPSGDACDSYHRYGEDIALLAEAGLDTYRFGVEWARIEPEDGWFSRAELDHYRRMAATCLDRGVTPMVTLQHFTAPKWFARTGGWEGEGAADRFGRYAERVAERLGDLVPWFCTINEANLGGLGDQPPHVGTSAGSTDWSRDDREAPVGGFPHGDIEVMARAHRRAVRGVKTAAPQARVGWTLSLADLQVAEGGESLRERALRRGQLDYLDVSRDDDFVGVQTYSRGVLGPEGVVPAPADAARMQTGWEIYPEAVENVVRLVASYTGRPVIVTENGIATADDEQRIDYLGDVLAGIERCVADGVDVRGYLCWTLLDNFEWMAGYAVTFGLVEVDRSTFARKPKPSLAWLGAVAAAKR